MRFLYNLLLHIFSPIILWVAYKHCHKHPHFKVQNCWKKRRGMNQNLRSGGILIHAVSAGETRATFPILKRLSQLYPNLPLILSSGSLNGAEQVSFYSADFEFQSTMLPIDYPLYVKRFMCQVQPRVVIVMETELWLNLYDYCYKHGIKILLINTRITEKSYQLYQYFSFGKKLFDYAYWIGVQSDADREKILSLGVDEVKVDTVGNLKSLSMMDADYSTEDTDTWQRWRKNHDFCWVAGSIHHDEVDAVLHAHLIFDQKTHLSSMLILVPRKPEEFKQIFAMVDNFCEQYNYQYAKYSDSSNPPSIADILIIDRMGYLSQIYSIADVAFVGGSLASYGGHNIFEPAVCAVPIISGPYYYDQKAMYSIFLTNEAIVICQNSEELSQLLVKLVDKQISAQLKANIQRSIQQMKEQSNRQLAQFRVKLREVLG